MRIAVRLLEVGTVANGPFDLDRLFRGIARIHVGFLRAEERLRRVGVAAENRLAANDHELVFAHDLCRGGDDVMQICAAHG